MAETVRIMLRNDAPELSRVATGYSGDAAVLAWGQALVATLGSGRVTSAVAGSDGVESLVVVEGVEAECDSIESHLNTDETVTAYRFV